MLRRMEQDSGVQRGLERRSSNRRPHRRPHLCGAVEDRRPTKRLFTPEIKRYLKSWLVRRRENPYPNRDEKKSLAVQTGLTYVQVCNWFANWRRKLKNAGGEPQKSTWGHLIKAYNSQAHGNIEHFSICSDDSIWEESHNSTKIDHCYTSVNTTIQEDLDEINGTTTNKFKNHIMEKYLQDLETPEQNNINKEEKPIDDRPKILTKWLKSAVNFKPRRENYVDWENKKQKLQGVKKRKQKFILQHDRQELDAAEALTRLAYASASAS